LTGRYLINLDSEDDGEIFIGCAGGVDTLAYFDYKKEAMPTGWKSFRIDIKGLKGGHSGDDINKGLANSNKLTTRFLWNAVRKFGIKLAAFDGGNLRNAIPREAYALLAVSPENVQPMVAYFQEFGQQAMEEFKYTEPDIYLSINETEEPLTEVIDSESTMRLLNALYSVASGVLAMSQAMPGMVETSTNLASVKMKDGRIEVVTSQRSSVESAKWDAAHMVESAFLAGGAEVKHSDGYPGWNPNPTSHLLDVTRKAHSELFGREAAVKSIHAGLECGLFLEKYPNLEMVSFGPTLRGVHSPDERIEIETVDRFWKWLLRTLETI
jgi:dipeptidase D